jgi:GT2 family glycosyltransferase
MTASVTVVTVTYNSGELVRSHRGAVPSAPWISAVFVDNASSDDSAAAVAEVYPEARFVQNDRNAGFSKAVNLGARELDTDFLLLLNPDAAITAGELEKVVATMSTRPEIAIGSPIVQDSAGEFATVAAGYAPTAAKMFTHATGLSRLGRLVRALRGHYLFTGDLARSGLQDVDWVSGGCMLIRSDVWKSLGGLTERWFMYAEDIEFCLRARQAGFRVVLDCDAHAAHEIGQSSKGVDGRVNPAWILNLYELYRWRIARSRAASVLWKLCVVAGFRARAAVFTLLMRLRGATPQRAANANRFRVYASALWHAPSALLRD